ncbi:MAG: hypothetical protein WBC93_04275 [Sulfitobacter sp.]
MVAIEMDQPATRATARGPLLMTIGLTYLVLMVCSVFQVIDPLVRHDDFPALLAAPKGFYVKTLYEGRWLNYWWHLREVVTPAWINFAVYQLFWAIFAAAAAVNACPRNQPFWVVIGLSLMIVVGPPAFLISLWFNTLIPGLGLVALFAVLSVMLRPQVTRWLLLIFVPVTLMAYTTYPMLLLAVCLTSRDTRRSWRDLMVLMTIFVISFALGMALIYTLNFYEHGIFGMEMAPWRNPTPAHDLASLLANLDRVSGFLVRSLQTLSFSFFPLMVAHLALLFGGLLVLSRNDRWATLYIIAGMVTGLSLVCLQTILTGVDVPVRAIAFIWTLYAVVCVRVLILALGHGGLYARMARNALIFVVASYLLQTAIQYSEARVWQSETRNMGNTLGPSDAPVYVIGDYMNIAGAEKAGIQNPRGIRLRLTYLTGRTVYTYEEEPEKFTDFTPEMLTNPAGSTPQIQRLGGKTVVYLPGDGT